MKADTIIECLNNLINDFTELKQIYSEKQKVLINFNFSDFQNVTRLEENALLKVQTDDKKRESLRRELLKITGTHEAKNQILKFSDILLKKVPTNIVHEVKAKEIELKDVINDVMKVNRVNLILIEHKKSFINEFLRLIYNKQNTSFVNRKI